MPTDPLCRQPAQDRFELPQVLDEGRGLRDLRRGRFQVGEQAANRRQTVFGRKPSLGSEAIVRWCDPLCLEERFGFLRVPD